MSKLKPSLRGENYTRQEKRAMWFDIHLRARCPGCGAEHSMIKRPHRGRAVNVMCSGCKAVFWTAGFPGFRAYPIKSETPEAKERR